MSAAAHTVTMKGSNGSISAAPKLASLHYLDYGRAFASVVNALVSMVSMIGRARALSAKSLVSMWFTSACKPPSQLIVYNLATLLHEGLKSSLVPPTRRSLRLSAEKSLMLELWWR